MAAESSWRHSIKARILAGGILVAVCAISATAWLAVNGTTGAIEHEQGEAAASTALSYDTLLGYGAAHRDFSAVSDTLAKLSRTTGLDLELTTTARTRIASTASNSQSPGKLVAVVDPLAVDPALQPGASADRIDHRAVGPFRLTEQEREKLQTRADQELVCMKAAGYRGQLITAPGGRPYVQASNKALSACNQLGIERSGRSAADQYVSDLMPSEARALRDLDTRIVICAEGGTDRLVKARFTASGGFAAAGPTDLSVFNNCLSKSRRQQLAAYVAPPALLFIKDSSGSQPASVGLPAAGAVRISIAAVGVLALTIIVGFLLASRVLRPLHILTGAAQRMRSGDRTARADVNAKWEIADLARAFNDMAGHVEATERQRNNLISDVSHELRTPISTLRGWLIATQDGLAEPDPALVGSLLEETDVLRHLVDDLQDLASADAGELRIFPEEIDATEVLHQIAAIRPELVTVQAPGELRVFADRVRLRQIFNNLVTNALRYSPPGEPVMVRGIATDGNIILEVIDAGSGIAAEDLPHVFDRFWRADKSRTRATGGSGLGLAIVKHLVDAHHGTIAVRSTLGSGTAFTITLSER